MTGSDVTLVFMSQNCNEFGTVQINGNATISLTASEDRSDSRDRGVW